MSLLANQGLNRTVKPVLGAVGLLQRAWHYAHITGYGLGTANQYCASTGGMRDDYALPVLTWHCSLSTACQY